MIALAKTQALLDVPLSGRVPFRFGTAWRRRICTILGRALFVILQPLVFIAFANDGHLAGFAFVMFMATLPFYVMHNPKSALYLRPPMLMAIWGIIALVFVMKSIFGPVWIGDVLCRLAIVITFPMTMLFTLVLLAIETVTGFTPPAPGFPSVTSTIFFSLLFYVQWVKFVPWLFGAKAAESPAGDAQAAAR